MFMKKPFIILAVVFVLFLLVVFYGVRVLWKHNKFLSIVFLIAAGAFAYIIYPIIEPIFW